MDFGGASFEAPRSEKSAQIPKKNRIGLMWKSVNPILYTDGLQSLPGTGVFSTANFHFLMRGQMSSFFLRRLKRKAFSWAEHFQSRELLPHRLALLNNACRYDIIRPILPPCGPRSWVSLRHLPPS